MRHFSKSQEKALRELADFQYLTTSQFARLGIAKSRTGVYPIMRGLCEAHNPPVKKISYNLGPARGSVEAVYYLTSRGVKLLASLDVDIGRIKYPRRNAVSFTRDYEHRVWTVDFFVSVKNWCLEQGHKLTDFHYYFQQSGGSNRNNAGGQSLSDNKLDIETQGVGYIVPDGVFLIERAGQKPLFSLFEQHNGKDTKKLLGQIQAHCVGIQLGTPSIKYGVTHEGEHVANRVFIAFEHEGCMQATMHRLIKSESFAPFMDFFLFKLSGYVNATKFDKGWIYANGREADFF